VSSRKLLGALAALSIAGCGAAHSANPKIKFTLRGAGSVLAGPIYRQWGFNLAHEGIAVDYAAVGSARGVGRLGAGRVDFAATEIPLAATRLAGAAVVHIPTALAAVAVSYNLPGLSSGLRLDGTTIAGIFAARIHRWNDPAIAALNPGVRLPAIAISVIHRTDPSATTLNFTRFLSARSRSWRRTVGAATKVRWPTGFGEAGNGAAARAIGHKVGAVGYVEQPFALAHALSLAAVRNRAGNFIAPSIATTAAAAADVSLPADLRRLSLAAPTNPAAYPIVFATFVVVPADLCRAGLPRSAAKALATFLDYGLGGGQRASEMLDYTPLPSIVLTAASDAVGTLRCEGKPIARSKRRRH
jgi:phosphate transport system substrate-binding protein